MKSKSLFITLLIAGGILTGCGGSSDDTSSLADDNFSVRLQLPDSLTGGSASNSPRGVANKIAGVALASKGSTGEPCSFIGHEDKNDPFRNGYETSRFLISTTATWTCVADLLIDLAAVVEHNGNILETDNDTLAPDYEADEPTHYSITLYNNCFCSSATLTISLSRTGSCSLIRSKLCNAVKQSANKWDKSK